MTLPKWATQSANPMAPHIAASPAPPLSQQPEDACAESGRADECLPCCPSGAVGDAPDSPAPIPVLSPPSPPQSVLTMDAVSCGGCAKSLDLQTEGLAAHVGGRWYHWRCAPIAVTGATLPTEPASVPAEVAARVELFPALSRDLGTARADASVWRAKAEEYDLDRAKSWHEGHSQGLREGREEAAKDACDRGAASPPETPHFLGSPGENAKGSATRSAAGVTSPAEPFCDCSFSPCMHDVERAHRAGLKAGREEGAAAVAALESDVDEAREERDTMKRQRDEARVALDRDHRAGNRYRAEKNRAEEALTAALAELAALRAQAEEGAAARAEVEKRATFAEGELSAAFGLPTSIGPTQGEAKRIVDQLRERLATLEHERNGWREIAQKVSDADLRPLSRDGQPYSTDEYPVEERIRDGVAARVLAGMAAGRWDFNRGNAEHRVDQAFELAAMFIAVRRKRGGR